MLIAIDVPDLAAKAVKQGETDSFRYGKLALFADPCGGLEFSTKGQDAIVH